MNRLLLWSILSLAGFGVSSAFAADDTSAPKKDDAPKQEAPAPAPAPKTDATAPADKNAKAAPSDAKAGAKAADAGKGDASSTAEATAKQDDTKKKAPEVLAPVQVNKNRLIEVNREIVELQDQIDREKKKTKSTEADKALNASRVSSALSIFGGSSAESRAELAKERVSLMESELELLTMSMAAKTPAERDDLQKQAAELREMRRNLERSGTGPIREK
jgi:hypothetical protein